MRLLEHSGIGVDVLLSDLSLEAGDMVEINVTIVIRMFCISMYLDMENVYKCVS